MSLNFHRIIPKRNDSGLQSVKRVPIEAKRNDSGLKSVERAPIENLIVKNLMISSLDDSGTQGFKVSSLNHFNKPTYPPTHLPYVNPSPRPPTKPTPTYISFFTKNHSPSYFLR